MTRNYNRTEILSYYDLTSEQQAELAADFSISINDAEEDQYVISRFRDRDTVLPLSMFMRTGNNFTHGVYSDSAFSGYFITLNRSNDEAVIAYKHF